MINGSFFLSFMFLSFTVISIKHTTLLHPCSEFHNTASAVTASSCPPPTFSMKTPLSRAPSTRIKHNDPLSQILFPDHVIKDMFCSAALSVWSSVCVCVHSQCCFTFRKRTSKNLKQKNSPKVFSAHCMSNCELLSLRLDTSCS